MFGSGGGPAPVGVNNRIALDPGHLSRVVAALAPLAPFGHAPQRGGLRLRRASATPGIASVAVAAAKPRKERRVSIGVRERLQRAPTVSGLGHRSRFDGTPVGSAVAPVRRGIESKDNGPT